MIQFKFIATAALLIGMLPAFAGDKPVIIDVRSDQEFSQGHVDGALHMPYERIGSMIGDQLEDKATSVVLYCRSGRRAGIAADTLAELGYTAVRNAGGLADLRAEMADGGEVCVTNC